MLSHLADFVSTVAHKRMLLVYLEYMTSIFTKRMQMCQKIEMLSEIPFKYGQLHSYAISGISPTTRHTGTILHATSHNLAIQA